MNAAAASGLLLWRRRLEPGQVPRDAALPPGVRLDSAVLNRETGLLYVYGAGSPELRMDALGAGVSRLEPVMDLVGASHAAHAPCHYVVETDAEDGWMDEIDRWYAQEHLPALASVPGCVRARRFICHGGGPRSFACYDLVHVDVVASPAWLAVRATDWSGLVRPRFINTRRTFFERLPPLRA